MSTSGMHRRPFEGRHLVFILNFQCYVQQWIRLNELYKLMKSFLQILN